MVERIVVHAHQNFRSAVVGPHHDGAEQIGRDSSEVTVWVEQEGEVQYAGKGADQRQCQDDVTQSVQGLTVLEPARAFALFLPDAINPVDDILQDACRADGRAVETPHDEGNE